jgi:hypothetical protein
MRQALGLHWTQLSSDPLFSRVQPHQAKKANAQYNPDLKKRNSQHCSRRASRNANIGSSFWTSQGKNLFEEDPELSQGGSHR